MSATDTITAVADDAPVIVTVTMVPVSLFGQVTMVPDGKLSTRTARMVAAQEPEPANRRQFFRDSYAKTAQVIRQVALVDEGAALQMLTLWTSVFTADSDAHPVPAYRPFDAEKFTASVELA